MHLKWEDDGTRPAERARLVDVVADYLELDPDLILAGDFNTTESPGDTAEGLASACGLVWVKPVNYVVGTKKNGNTYDHIFVSPSLADSWCIESEIVTFLDEEISWDVSDHRPVIARFSELPCPEPEPRAVVINEFRQDGDPGQEWVELYNGGTAPVDIGGWQIIGTHGRRVIKEIPFGTVIQPGGFLVFSHSTQWLDDIDEIVELRDASGAKVDDTSPSRDEPSGSGYTWSRVPDGGEDWISRKATRGSTNGESYSPWELLLNP